MPNEWIKPANMHEAAYAHAVKAGNTLYLAGQIARDASGNLVGEGDFTAQAHQVWRNIQTILEASGAGLSDIVRITTYLVRRQDIPASREVGAHWFPEGRPASTLLVIDALATPELFIEVDVIAAV